MEILKNTEITGKMNYTFEPEKYGQSEIMWTWDPAEVYSMVIFSL